MPFWTQEKNKRNQERPNKAPKTTKTDQETENRTKNLRSTPAGAFKKKSGEEPPPGGGVGEG